MLFAPQVLPLFVVSNQARLTWILGVSVWLLRRRPDRSAAPSAPESLTAIARSL